MSESNVVKKKKCFLLFEQCFNQWASFLYVSIKKAAKWLKLLHV